MRLLPRRRSRGSLGGVLPAPHQPSKHSLGVDEAEGQVGSRSVSRVADDAGLGEAGPQQAGSFAAALAAHKEQVPAPPRPVPPHLLFELLADPHQHEAIFDDILEADAELLECEGPRKKWRLDYRARWAFWKVSGVCENRLWMWTDREAGTVTFKLREPGFLRRYEGTWTIKAACGTPLSECYAAAESLSGGSSSGTPSSWGSRCSSPTGSSSSGSGGWRGAGAAWERSAAGERLRSFNPFAGGSSGGGAAAAAEAAPSPFAGLSVAPMARVSGGAGALPLPPIPGLGGAVAAIGRLQASLASTLANSAANFGGLTAAINPWAACLLPPLPLVLPRLGSLDSLDTSLSRRSSSSSSLSWRGGGSPRAGSGHGNGSSARGSQALRLPRDAIITAQTLTSPSVTPPIPINQVLKSQSKGQVADMLDGLVRAAAARLEAQPLLLIA